MRGDRINDLNLGYHVDKAFYSNPFEVEFFKNDVNNSIGQFGKLNAAQRADYIETPTGKSWACYTADVRQLQGLERTVALVRDISANA